MICSYTNKKKDEKWIRFLYSWKNVLWMEINDLYFLIWKYLRIEIYSSVKASREQKDANFHFHDSKQKKSWENKFLMREMLWSYKFCVQ